MIKGLIKKSLAGMGFHLVRAGQVHTLEAHLREVLAALRINCVLDVGANDGDYGDSLRRLGYAGHIISFEPVESNFRRLSERIRRDGKWMAHRLALGEVDGEAEINVLEGHTFSSFLVPSAYGKRQFGDKMKVERKEMVPLRRLDHVLDEVVKAVAEPRLFLKTDTQGYDMAVIRGGGERLKDVLGVQMEVAVRSLYESGTTGLCQVIPALQELGFEPTGMFSVTRNPSDRLTVVEMDCVMCRPGQTAGGAQNGKHA